MTPRTPSAASAPIRLVGREEELEAVRAALADAATRVIVATGPAGAGKTALLRAAVDEAAAEGALSGLGKYPEGYAGRDLDPVIAAVEGAVTAGLEQLYDPDAGLRDLAAALGDNTHVFTSVAGSVLRALAGAAPDAPLTAQGADAQLAEAVVRVLRWLEGFGAAVLLMIDDWGRAGPQAQRVLRRVVSDAGLTRTRLLATERTEEPFPPPIAAKMAGIEVWGLPPPARLELARAVLGARAAAAVDVLDFLGPAAERPFDLIESVRVLTADEAIVPRGPGSWRLDRARGGRALAGAAAGSVVDRALQAAPAAPLLAQLLAVHGDGAEAEDLARAAGLAEAEARRTLAALADRGLVQWTGMRIAFAHDRLRAEVLQRIGPAARQEMAARYADALVRGGAEPGDGERGMGLLWLRQEAGLSDVEPRWWRDAFTEGAVRAREIGDRAAAERFVASALQLAAVGAGFSYRLLGEAAFAAITRGDDAEARRHADRMQAYAASPQELAAAQELRVFARRASGDLDGALDVASEVVARNGVKLPRRLSVWDLAHAVLRCFTLDPRRAVRPLDEATLATDGPMMRAINGIGSLIFERNPPLVVVWVTRTLRRELVYGTAAGAATYSLISCAFGDYRRAAAWAEAADRLQRPEQPLRAVAKQYSTNFGHVFVRPRPETRGRGDEMAALAYAGGDLAVAAYGNRDKVLDALFSDDPLDGTEAVADEAIRVAERLGDAATIPHVRALRQFLDQLRRAGPDGWRLDGAHFDHAAQRRTLETEGLANTGRGVAALEALLGVLFGRYGEVAELSRRSWPRFGSAPFQAQTQIWAFATGLALYRTGGAPSKLVLWNLRRLGRLNPNDFRHRTRLLDAERARVRGRRRQAMSAYREAVEAAARSRCLMEHGLVAAAAAEGAEALGEAGDARLWREAAIAAWRRLGAEALLAARYGLAHAVAADAQSDAAEAAQRASRAKSRLLATVGHELRTPLQGALGLIELAERPGESVDLKDLRQAIQGLAGVVEDLTDLGALEGGLLSIRKAPLDVAALVHSVVSLHQAAAAQANRQLDIRISQEAPRWVLSDAVRVRQVLGNLVVNALRHGRGRVEIGVEAAGPRLRFWVADEGPELDPGVLHKIFEPFERGVECDDGGLGVGLFLGRHLARAMGGDLRVSPRIKGKAFELEIAAPPAAPAAAEPVSELAGLRVLIAEDTDLSRRVLAALLRGEGCDVREASDGRTALDLAAAETFDLLLLDQRMPQLTGIEVAERLAGHAGGGRIVLMSAGLESELRRRAAACGVADVLDKPIALDDLRRAAGPLSRSPSRPPGERRIDELRRHLGAAAEPLLEALRPTLDAEFDALDAAMLSGDPAPVEARLHRLRGLAGHFGLDNLTAALLDVGARPLDVAALKRAAKLDWADPRPAAPA
jgi:signal transduction histidine kinase/ActR/RegA family two-component response regulator